MNPINIDVAAQYFPILLFYFIAIVMAVVIFVLPNILVKKKPNADKLIGYECGFDPFGDARAKFDIRFYLVAILFIIFDLEIAFLIPWAVSLGKIGLFGFWSMFFFLGLLTIGLIYEWRKGALEWE